MGEQRIRGNALVTAVGIFLLVGAVYAVVSSGRIDIIDGQYRFEVAKNIVEDASVQVSDPNLDEVNQGETGAYSPYSISGSVVAIPLIWLAKITGPSTINREQFFFSFTSAVLGAASMAVLFLFYVYLGISRRSAIGWTLVTAFATLLFTASATVFDQAQQAFFLITPCFLAWIGAKRDSMPLMVAAGVLLAILVNFQNSYAIMFPGVALAALGEYGTADNRKRRSYERALVLLFVAGMGLLFWAAFNDFRFGKYLDAGTGHNHPFAFGNPLVGLAGLLVSPGKSIFLYSPATIVALFGLRRLTKAEHFLGLSVITTILLHLALISCLSFWGGDWCWGPRYFATTLPVVSLGFPFAVARGAFRRYAFRTLIAAGIVVQLLGLSLDQHRFFFGHSLPRFFWYTNPGYYFTHSALFDRPGEILESIRDGVPKEAVMFRPGPNQDEVTYTVFGMWGRPDLPPPIWMRYFSVFWLPRPWPFWMTTIPEELRPVNVETSCLVLLLMGIAGTVAIVLGRTRVEAPETVHATG